MLTNRQYAFARDLDGVRVIVTVNNDDNAASMDLPAGNADEYVGTLTGEKVSVVNGRIHVTIVGNSGNIWVPAGNMPEYKPVEASAKVSETKLESETKSETENKLESDATNKTDSKAEAKTTNNANASANNIKEINPNTSEADAGKTSTAPSDTSVPKSDAAEVIVDWSKTPEDMSVEELQAGILAKMAKNGPVTDQMKKTVYDNIWHDSLVNWLKSFH